MRSRDWLISLVSLLLAAALFTTAGLQLDTIKNARTDMKLDVNQPLKNVPPSLTFASVAMGAFRGLIVDVLWIRAETKKEKGQFFDARQLAEWITMLQPRFPAVWEFQAWNMAYNISVAIPAQMPEQRWRWVKNGYELLRDKGIEINPKSLRLYRHLALIFQHKMGGVTDDVHKYYKLKFASEMEPLLGPADKQFFKELAAAPETLQQVKTNPEIAKFINALISSDPAFEEDDKLVASYLSLRQNPDRYSETASNVIEDFSGSQALHNFDIFAKANYLRTVWKMDPVLMQQLNNRYGPVSYNDPNEHLPLDWRHPDCHAIYWATKGLQFAGEDQAQEGQTNTERIIAHSLQNLFRNGNIYIYDMTDPESEQLGQTVKSVYLRPDLRMFQPYNESRLKMIENYEDMEGVTSGSLQSFKIGHRNMLKNAILSFYMAGHTKMAANILRQLQTLYPDPAHNGPLVAFAKRRLREETQGLGMNDFKEMVTLLLREGYFQYAMHEDDEAAAREAMAKEVYENFKAGYSEVERLQIPEFSRIRYLALRDFFYDEQYPPVLRQNLIARIKVEKPELFDQLVNQEKIIHLKDKTPQN